MVSPSAITKRQFDELLEQYPALIKEVSASKAKAGQATLESLDRYRYDEAPDLFAGEKPEKDMDLEAIKKLVEWKLRHGKFRPTLMSLVSSNDPKFAADTARDAFSVYRGNIKDKNSSTKASTAALGTLTKLKGIGPATASLLLSVHDPERAIFFSDEAFLWLCAGAGGGGGKAAGSTSVIKYNAKEYGMLTEEAGKLSKRLGVSATDIEKVAYVVMKKPATTEETSKNKEAKARNTATSSSSTATTTQMKDLGDNGKIDDGGKVKRKTVIADAEKEEGPPLRRSKRTKP